MRSILVSHEISESVLRVFNNYKGFVVGHIHPYPLIHSSSD